MVADKVAATVNAQAITAALVQRGRTGEGMYIETSMLESNIAFNWPDVMMHCTLLDSDATHLPNLLASYRVYQCLDGHISLAIGNDVQWQSFCTAFGLESLAKDEKYEVAADRALRMPEFFALLASITAAYDVDTVVERLRKADVPVTVVLLPEAVKEDVHVVDRELIRKAYHPDMGKFLQPRAATNMFGVGLTLTPAPAHGEHSREILQELGHKQETIIDLIDQGVIFAP
jgi:formyl-CoA transferase